MFKVMAASACILSSFGEGWGQERFVLTLARMRPEFVVKISPAAMKHR
jgi:hypothetical protein